MTKLDKAIKKKRLEKNTVSEADRRVLNAVVNVMGQLSEFEDDVRQYMSRFRMIDGREIMAERLIMSALRKDSDGLTLDGTTASKLLANFLGVLIHLFGLADARDIYVDIFGEEPEPKVAARETPFSKLGFFNKIF